MKRILLLLAALGLASCASLQRNCAERDWMLCGDRIAVQKRFVYLDDPAFLYNNKAVAERAGSDYAFRLAFFFNPYRERTVRVSASVRPNASSGRAPAACALAGGLALPDSAAGGRWDSAFTVAVSKRKDRVNLAFACPGYEPRWGRQDTLELAFTGGGDAPAQMLLPFTTSFHGPVYSFVIGSVLILSLTAVGNVVAANR